MPATRRVASFKVSGKGFLGVEAGGRKIALSLGEPEARQWIQTPKRALGNVSPLIMARTDAGVQEVEDLLGRIEFGIPS